MPEFDLKSFETWLDENRIVVKGLNVYRRLKQGFSFRIFETDNAAQVAPHFEKYQMSIDDMQRFWPRCLAKGYEYCQVLTDREVNLADKISLIDLSEANGHIFHNAAVLYLENLVAGPEKKRTLKAYEETLKDLWLVQVRFFGRGDSRRRQTLIDYLRAHTVLGKVIRLRATQFHDGPNLLRMHPAFWGLFLFSRTCRADNLHAPIVDGSAEFKWRGQLAQWNRSNDDDPNHYVTRFMNDIRTEPARYPIYEPLPRDFTDPQVAPPDVYLHRSKGHGRDDFLVVNTTDNERAVFCTKGVGADLDRVMATITREWQSSDLERYWSSEPAHPGSESSPLPFEYQFIQGHTGWSVLGFCIDVGNMGEHLGQDYYNFADMYEFVVRWRAAAAAQKSIPSLGRTVIDWLPRVFVEPYACVEISSHYRGRLRKPIGDAKTLQAKTAGLPAKPQAEEVFFGMPVQIVTGAPCETSLRLQKTDQGGAPAYDYDCPELERKEWARCVGPIHGEIDEAVNRDRKVDDSDDKSALAVAYQLAAILVASFIAFQKKGWLTGRSNPSFAPRNFGSGPRDSPDWVSFEDVVEKDRFSLQYTELSNVKSSLREYIGRSLAVYDLWCSLIADEQSFPGALVVLMPEASGKPDLLRQMKARADKSPAAPSASAQLARSFVRTLIDINPNSAP